MKLVVATFNLDKLRELAELLSEEGVAGMTLVTLKDFPGAIAPEETGSTLLENALIKARAAFALTGLPSIADDTGLEVDALNGRPGVHSARYAGPEALGPDNIRKLLAELAAVSPASRAARFRTVCVAVLGHDAELDAEGALEGTITTVPRGTKGFGYDPVFEVEGGRTLAELDAEQKNAISHRARAVRALAAKLRVQNL